MEKKAQKMNFESAVKKIEGISNTADIIMRNRLIIAIFLIVDGITFLQNPEATLPGMAKNIILLVLLATFSVFITNLATKVKDTKTIIISTLILVVGGVMYFYPDLIAAYIQLALSLLIIFDGVKNIASTLHLNKLSGYTKAITKKYEKIANRKTTDEKKHQQMEKFKEADSSLDNELEGQKNKLLTPLKNIVNRTSKFSALYIIMNITTITLGVILLVFPDVSMSVWGLIFLYTGVSNLIASMRSMNLLKKIKEKRFKEIIFDAKKNGENKGTRGDNKKEPDVNNSGDKDAEGPKNSTSRHDKIRHDK